MIKFFRRLRKSLISQNSLTKYIFYAVGEIVLVVIGILFALQINNWHQNNLRLKQEKVLLAQLKTELLDIYGDVLSDLIILTDAEKSHYKILNYLEKDKPYIDSICIDFFFLKQDEYIYPMTATYGKIKELGLDIIQDDSLRNNLQTLYEVIFPRISRENSFTKDISDYLDPYYVKHFIPNSDYGLKFHFPGKIDSLGGRIFKEEPSDLPSNLLIDGETIPFTLGFVPVNFEELKKDNQFLMLLKEADKNRKYKTGRYLGAKSKIQEIVNAIDSIL